MGGRQRARSKVNVFFEFCWSQRHNFLVSMNPNCESSTHLVLCYSLSRCTHSRDATTRATRITVQSTQPPRELWLLRSQRLEKTSNTPCPPCSRKAGTDGGGGAGEETFCVPLSPSAVYKSLPRKLSNAANWWNILINSYRLHI